MIYLFICPQCKDSKEIEKPMLDPMPKVFCTKCEIEMKRDYKSEQKDKATIIPDEHKSINSSKVEFKYDKSPSKRKHFW